MSITTRLERVVDETNAGRRLASAVAAGRARRVQLHWTNLLGVVTVACLTVLIVTGIVLMFFYTPSSERVVYEGSYAPLHGADMSRAFESTLALSFDVRGGLLIRQAHHWAALLFPAVVLVQLLATFFTGAFRRRAGSWVLLVVILLAGLAAGWSGYALPDDMLSGTGLVIVHGILLGIPVVGTWASALLFGGGFPGQAIENLYPIHLLVSVLLIVVVAARIRSGWRHGARHFAGRGDAMVPLLPNAARRAAALFTLVCGVLVLMAATVTISPVYAPADPGNVSAGSQPDWYTGFLDGALRLVPPGWEVQLGGYTLTLAVLVPLMVVGAFIAAVLLYPFIEKRFMPEQGDPELLDRPHNVPTRTAIGVAGMTFYGVLWGAASADVAAATLRLPLEGVVTMFQVLLFVGPPIAFAVTRRVCLGLQHKDREVLAHGYETGRIVRLPGGHYVEVHEPIPTSRRAELSTPADVAPARYSTGVSTRL
ncbi:MAG TPA: cytochrome b N-terminal domain-containing protein [Pseudolysinimonas sp.]|nr:cytochrome b N-terminal domain-containing protein [Pseudolysinimonas sp.]